MIRQASVAGSFYPGNQSALEEKLKEYISVSSQPQKVIGLISPHAGYVFSGRCAGKAFGMIKIPDTVIIIGVNHRGVGYSFTIDDNEYWRTPLGDIEVDKHLQVKLVTRSKIFKADHNIGLREHSLEVQVPFIQYLNSKAKILPIVISSSDVTKLIEAGKEIAEAIKNNPEVLLVASTDMSHFIDAEQAKYRDYMAIKEINQLNPNGLFEVVQSKRISMCGVAPTTMMLTAANQLGATTAEEVEYTNSGVVSGDLNEVVAYLSMLIY